MSLDKFFNPQSIAIIGATENELNITSAIFNNLFEMGYKGTIVPVNPHYEKVFGLKCCPSILDYEDNIDLSIITISSEHIPEILSQHIERKINNVVIISGGFAETGKRGIVLEAEIKKICRENNIRIIGPNCLGVLNNYSNFSTFFLPWSKIKRPSRGHLSILSQSGSYAASMLDMLYLEGIGVSKFVSYGNRVDVGESELIEYLTGDDSTRVIGIYMESVDDGRRFIRASRLCSCYKHIVVLKVGRQESGINAARSHTGAIAGRYEIYKAAFRKSGVLEVYNLEEFLDACKVLLMQKPARGNKILVITNGGGFGVAVSDMCSDTGLNLAQTPPGIREYLSEHFPEFFIFNNPIDLTGSAGDKDFGIALKTAFVDNDFYDAAIIIPLMPPPAMTEGVVDVISERAKESGKPVVVCTIKSVYTKKTKEKFESKNIPVFMSPERAVKAMNVLVERGKMDGC
ncbi:acetate--CoA ligase family protein [Candidatus Scalindua japonica]|nr:CoA-binding protein [Candidatus Scalindua japonica]